MAKVNLNEVPSQGRPFIPTDTYPLRISSCEFVRTKKNQEPMFKFGWEFCAPESVLVLEDGRPITVKLAGRTFNTWVVLNDMGLPKIKGLHKALGIPMEIDTDAPNTRVYVGKGVNTRVSSELETMKDETTGEPILEEGKPVQTVVYKTVRFLSPAPTYNKELPY